VTRAHGSQDSFWRPSLSAEGKLRRAAGARRGILFRDRRKRSEPQDRQRPAIGSRGRGGTNRRGGEKPRGRHADGNWRSHLERGAERRATGVKTGGRSTASHRHKPARGSTSPGVGFLGRYDGGAIFGQPQERKPGFAAGSQGPERVGLLAPRSGGSREPLRKCW